MTTRNSPMSLFIRLSALALLLSLAPGCRSKGAATTDAPSQAAGPSQADGPAASGGPTEAEVQQALVTGLPGYINDYCKPDKANLLESVKTLRFKLSKQEVANTVDGSYKLMRVYGTIYWSYADKKNGRDPAAGNEFVNVMTNDPGMNSDRTTKWEFLGVGPWSQLLYFNFPKGCMNFD